MLYILWAILNIGLFVFILFRGLRYFKQKYGPVVAGIFVLAFFGLVGAADSGSENMKPVSNQIKTWHFNAPNNLNTPLNTNISVPLEQMPFSKTILGISYGIDADKKNIPISSYSTTTGLISGTSWVPASIIVSPTTDNQKFSYEVVGTTRWKLLGITLYSQLRKYDGIARLP